MEPTSAAPKVFEMKDIGASYQKEGKDTIVKMKKSDGKDEYSITITFSEPIDEANIRSYLQSQETIKKIDQLVKQFDIFEPLYKDKKNFHLESFGSDLVLYYDKKKGGLARFDLSEKKYQITAKSRLDDYQRKIDDLDKKDTTKAARVRLKKERFRKQMEEFAKLAETLVPPRLHDLKAHTPKISVEGKKFSSIAPTIG